MVRTIRGVAASPPAPPPPPRLHLQMFHFSHLAAGASFDAAKVIARKNDVPSLRAAAGLARISGEAALARSLALRCAKDLAAARDWIGAQDVLSAQDVLLAHRLHLCVAELMAATLTDRQAESQPAARGHPWASLDGDGGIQGRVRDVWEAQFGVSQHSTGHRGAGALLQELESAESPTPTANVPLGQVRAARPPRATYGDEAGGD